MNLKDILPFILSISIFLAGDSMITRSNNMKFTTIDQKNDNFEINCAVAFKGAWWHNDCHDANLNGLYLRGTHDSLAMGSTGEHGKGTTNHWTLPK
ncbi:techylectin-5A [Trichonephila clavata]|uniref:Techylectin-5A n=1 Tax=Trichonephila clavata TaxID=2740835 RepID=A0A8X6JHQ1_TRICU|nr:techylectin-5A [Trichonephila clavata]